jgi:hypothetical protein
VIADDREYSIFEWNRIPGVNEFLLSKAMAAMGSRGGKKRAEKLTAEQRRESAIKASRAAAEARTQRARDRSSETHETS